jgi:hypothetical protein
MLNNTTWLGFIKKVGYCSKSCVNVWTFICLLGFLKFGDAQNHPSHGFTMLAWKQPCCLGKSSMSSEESKFLQNNYPSYPWGFLKWTTGFQPSEWPTRGYPRVILRAYDMPSQVVFMYAAVWIYNNLYILNLSYRNFLYPGFVYHYIYILNLGKFESDFDDILWLGTSFASKLAEEQIGKRQIADWPDQQKPVQAWDIDVQYFLFPNPCVFICKYCCWLDPMMCDYLPWSNQQVGQWHSSTLVNAPTPKQKLYHPFGRFVYPILKVTTVACRSRTTQFVATLLLFRRCSNVWAPEISTHNHPSI